MRDGGIDLDLLSTVVQGRGTGVLGDINRGALERFRQVGLPTTREEDWKYTSLESVAGISNAWMSHAVDGAIPGREVTPPAEIDAIWITIRDGQIDDDTVASANATLAGLAEVRRLSARHSTKSLRLDNAVASFNAALISDALCLDVRQGAQLERPIGVLFDDQGGDKPGANHARILLTLDDNASAGVIEFHRSAGGGEHYASVVAEVQLGTGSNANYLKIQERDAEHQQVSQVHAHIGRDASFNHASIDLGGRMIRNDVMATIASPGGHFGSAGLALTEDGHHIDNHIAADHRVGPATSSQNYRCIAAGRSRCVFNGKAIVREGADGTDAKQSNHNLLLSEAAEIDTKPELEIYAEDVKCAHGATVGQLDEKSLFYLRSRGIDRDEAARILTRAFANAVLDDVPVASAIEYLGRATDLKLDSMVEEPLS